MVRTLASAWTRRFVLTSAASGAAAALTAGCTMPVTEASALGVVGIMISALVRGELNWAMIRDSARATLQTCGMIIWIGLGASALVGVYNLMGGIDFVESVILSLSNGHAMVTVLIMMVILLVVTTLQTIPKL